MTCYSTPTFDQSTRERLQLFPSLDQEATRRNLDGDLLAAVSSPDVKTGVLIEESYQFEPE